MDYHRGTIEADVDGGVIDAEAIYRIDAVWGPRNRGVRSIWHVNDCTLDEWTFDGRKQTRATLCALLGEDEVERQEQLALEAWLETAVENDASDWADYRYDMAAE